LFELKEPYHAVWAKLTRENIGKAIAIVVDGIVYSYPIVQSEIAGGRASISGNMTLEEAKMLAAFLKFGALENNLTVKRIELVKK
jgi:SecD/SecF fusion protein